jgi:hypothetical protein
MGEQRKEKRLRQTSLNVRERGDRGREYSKHVWAKVEKSYEGLDRALVDRQRNPTIRDLKAESKGQRVHKRESREQRADKRTWEWSHRST